MVVIDVEVISREIIKPSSPTPQNLRNLKLSFFDQIQPRIYIPVILFYDIHSESSTLSQVLNDNLQRSCLLKKSLAECLTLFYPLAGKMRDDFTIECDDEGIEYLETLVKCKLSEPIENPDSEVLKQLLPFNPYTGDKREVVLSVQFNIFDCGGVAIGVCVSHRIADGTSAVTFLNSWAAISRGCGTDDAKRPIFNAALLFPPRVLPAESSQPRRELIERRTSSHDEKIVTKRFMFDKSNIIALREKAVASDGKLPTRYQAVSALIWQRFMAVIQSKSRSAGKIMCVAIHPVNLRAKMVPQLPTHFFGNIFGVARVAMTIDGDKDLRSLTSLIENAISSVKDDYNVKEIKSSDNNNNCDQLLLKGSESIELLIFGSWLNFPVYEADFGWGKPTWSGGPGSTYKNLAGLTSTRDGDGIEAFVNLVEEDMFIFEHDPELLSFVALVK